jgi:hypothetical protein
MSAIFEEYMAVIGFTPLVQINKLGSGKALLASQSKSSGSVKDRITIRSKPQKAGQDNHCDRD